MGNKIKNLNKKFKKIEDDKNAKNEIIEVEEIVKNPNLKLTEKKFPGAYCDWGLGNSFAVFTLDKQNYIIYSTENKSLIFYNLDKDLKEKEIKDAHLKEINDIKFYEKQYKNYYIIMTVSGSDVKFKNMGY